MMLRCSLLVFMSIISIIEILKILFRQDIHTYSVVSWPTLVNVSMRTVLLPAACSCAAYYYCTSSSITFLLQIRTRKYTNNNGCPAMFPRQIHPILLTPFLGPSLGFSSCKYFTKTSHPVIPLQKIFKKKHYTGEQPAIAYHSGAIHNIYML